MNLDEQTLVDALHEIDPLLPGDFATRVRTGGRRRLLRRRAYAAAGVVAFAAVVAPVALALTSSGNASFEPAKQHVYPGLYAPPPTPGTECNAGRSDAAPTAPAAYSDLLLLPPAGQAASASVGPGAFECLTPHIALTALKLQGEHVVAGVVVAGPDAPTPEEVAVAGPGVHFGGQLGHLPIHGQPASEFTFVPGGAHTEIYWTEPDGGQWRATVQGMSQVQAVALVDQITLDSRAGTAAMPAAADGWSVEPAAADVAAGDNGVMSAEWTDSQGHDVNLTVTQGPDRTRQFAAGAPAGPYGVEGYIGPLQFVTVRGNHLAAYGAANIALLFWQESPHAEVLMSITGADEAEIEQVADSLRLASPNDPRINYSR